MVGCFGWSHGGDLAGRDQLRLDLIEESSGVNQCEEIGGNEEENDGNVKSFGHFSLFVWILKLFFWFVFECFDVY